MKQFLLIVILSSLAFLCGTILSAEETLKPQTDDELCKKLIGTWSLECSGTEADYGETNVNVHYSYHVKEITTYTKSNNYFSKDIILIQEQHGTNAFQTTNEITGQWQIKNGILTAVNQKRPDIKESEFAKYFKHCKIIYIDDQKFIYYLSSKSLRTDWPKITENRVN